jgi:hypothetical protein
MGALGGRFERPREAEAVTRFTLFAQSRCVARSIPSLPAARQAHTSPLRRRRPPAIGVSRPRGEIVPVMSDRNMQKLRVQQLVAWPEKSAPSNPAGSGAQISLRGPSAGDEGRGAAPELLLR